MADTPRDYASNIAQIVSGGSSTTAQAIRDILASVRHAIESPLRRPTSTNAADEEFDTAGNMVNLNMTGATVSYANSKMILTRPSTDATDVFRGTVKACPAGAWTFEAELSISGVGTSWQFLGLGARRGGGTAPNVANTATDKLAAWGVGSNTSGAFGAYAMKANTGSGVAGSTAFNGAAPNTRIGNGGTIVVRVAFDGTDTLTCTVSNDGVGFVQYYSGSATTLIGGAPDSICLVINNETAFDCVGVCDYLRRIA